VGGRFKVGPGGAGEEQRLGETYSAGKRIGHMGGRVWKGLRSRHVFLRNGELAKSGGTTENPGR